MSLSSSLNLSKIALTNLRPALMSGLVSKRSMSSSLGVNTFTELPESHQMMKDTCRQFAETELWPIAGKIDK